jgi:hypothetical protein
VVEAAGIEPAWAQYSRGFPQHRDQNATAQQRQSPSARPLGLSAWQLYSMSAGVSISRDHWLAERERPAK